MAPAYPQSCNSNGRVAAQAPLQHLPKAWKQRAEQLLALSGDSLCHALVMLGHHSVYLHAVDPRWVEGQFVPFANSRTKAADAFWEGLLWKARVPGLDLFTQLKPSLLDQAKDHMRKGQRAENIAGFLLQGWSSVADGGSGETEISDAEFRDILIDANDDVRRGTLQYLEEWRKQHPEQWHDLVLPFFEKVWPRQRALKTAPLSQALARFILSSDDLFPDLVKLLKSRLSPLRDGGSWLFAFKVDEVDTPVKRYPRETLELLWVLLPEDTSQWWFEIDKILPLLEDNPDTKGDPRLSEMRRRLAR